MLGRYQGVRWAFHTSERETGAAECAPEALEIGDGQLARPCGCVVVVVDGAGLRTTTGRCWGSLHYLLRGARDTAPGGITAEGAHRGPLGHGQRRRAVVQ